MHRSGTSLIGEALHRWGAFGRANECLQADTWNARGYWELSPLVSFNERLLQETGATWSFPPSQRDDSRLALLAEDPAYKEEAHRLIASMKTGSAKTWFWKDPRLSLLLPFWQKIWGEVRYIICVRDPLEICRSLKKRDDLSFPVSILLWQRYMLSILEWTRRAPTIAIGYSRMLRNPAAECARLSSFLENSAGRLDCDGATVEMAKAVDRELRHFKSEGPPPSAVLTDSQKELQGILESLANRAPASAELDLGRCSLPRVWRGSLKTNLLLLRCRRRLNRAYPDLSETWNDVSRTDRESVSKLGAIGALETEPLWENRRGLSLSKEDFLSLAIAEWFRW
jgi:hypothetical protein